MSPVFFDEQNEFIMKTQNTLGQRQPSMVQFVLKTGITQNEKVAAFILLIAACVMIFATYWMLSSDARNDGVVTDRFGDQMTIEQYVDRLESNYYRD